MIRILLALALLLVPSAVLAQDFPVTIEHSFGSTTVPAKPERVVSIGYVEQDFLYALGIAPVGVRNWWGEHEYATWPWAQDARKAVNATPEVLSGDELNLEWVVAQNPDLIIAVYQDIDQDAYDELSKIAPVVALPKGYPTWGAPWQEELKIIDRATSGNTTKAEKIIADIEAKFAEVKTDYPQFAGKTATNFFSEEGNFYAYGPEDTASRFIVDLGFTFPDNLGEGDPDYNKIDIAAENMRLLDVDVAIWPIDEGDTTTQPTIEAMPLYQNLRLSREGRSVWLDDGKGTLYGALSFSSPLSISYLLDVLPPALAAAVDGDPATPVPSFK